MVEREAGWSQGRIAKEYGLKRPAVSMLLSRYDDPEFVKPSTVTDVHGTERDVTAQQTRTTSKPEPEPEAPKRKRVVEPKPAGFAVREKIADHAENGCSPEFGRWVVEFHDPEDREQLAVWAEQLSDRWFGLAQALRGEDDDRAEPFGSLPEPTRPAEAAVEPLEAPETETETGLSPNGMFLRLSADELAAIEWEPKPTTAGPCPTCDADDGEPCFTNTGALARQPHAARFDANQFGTHQAHVGGGDKNRGRWVMVGGKSMLVTDAVACPDCGAAPGAWCRNKAGNVKLMYHQGRTPQRYGR